eukprot:Phypoly_transcript_16810.p1 GENE.Phypoly_transcript_16810~~Phypoly_transcript_16810.p1  ORF type:complete len:222 (+),score=21.55 Phypoly_transcript_16810:94-759(+)
MLAQRSLTSRTTCILGGYSNYAKGPTRSQHKITFPTDHFEKVKKENCCYCQDAGGANKVLRYATVGMAAVGCAAIAKDSISGLFASTGVWSGAPALNRCIVDLSDIQEGEAKRVEWRHTVYYIIHRSPEEIETANLAPSDLRDHQSDAERVQKPEWLVVNAHCTHLGCVTIPKQGDYDGFFCPCHGAHYDSSGRVRKGPAPKNLVVPKYQFLTDSSLELLR